MVVKFYYGFYEAAHKNSVPQRKHNYFKFKKKPSRPINNNELLQINIIKPKIVLVASL